MAKKIRLIDANSFSPSELYERDEVYYRDTFYSGVRRVLQAICDAPTVDAVQVVRCKDCIYWESGKSYVPYCNRFENGLQDCEADDFCSYGERRSEQAWITRRK